MTGAFAILGGSCLGGMSNGRLYKNDRARQTGRRYPDPLRWPQSRPKTLAHDPRLLCISAANSPCDTLPNA